MRRRARQALARHDSAGDQQALDLANRAPRVLPLGRQHCLLQRRRYLGTAAVRAGLGRKARNTLFAPCVVPSLNGLLAHASALGAWNGVLALGQFADHSLQLAPPELLAADHGAQHGQSEQGQ